MGGWCFQDFFVVYNLWANQHGRQNLVQSSRVTTYSQEWRKVRCNDSTLYPDLEFFITRNRDLGKKYVITVDTLYTGYAVTRLYCILKLDTSRHKTDENPIHFAFIQSKTFVFRSFFSFLCCIPLTNITNGLVQKIKFRIRDDYIKALQVAYYT